MVDVQERALSALEEHLLARAASFMQRGHRVRHVRSQHQRGLAQQGQHFVGVHRLDALAGDEFIVQSDALGHFLAQGIGIAQSAAAKAHPLHLVRIRGTDTATGGADLLRAASRFTRLVETLVVGHGEVSAVGDQQVLWRDLHALAAQLLEFLHQSDGVQHHAIGDHIQLCRPKDAAGHEMQHILHVVVNDRVPGVVAALGTHHHVHFLREIIDDLAFAFIAPLGADYDCVCHEIKIWMLDAGGWILETRWLD